MKKVFITICSIWLLIAFLSPIILASRIEEELLNFEKQYPEIEISSYQRDYFSSTIQGQIAMPHLGFVVEQEIKITHSPLLFSGFNWLQANGKNLEVGVNLLGKLQAKIGKSLWQSSIYSLEKGELMIDEQTIFVENGYFQLKPWYAEVFLKEKKLTSPEIFGQFTYKGKTYTASGKNVALYQTEKKIHFEIEEISGNLGLGKPQLLQQIQGIFDTKEQQIHASFLPKFTWPLLALNNQPITLNLENQIFKLTSKGKMRVLINLSKKRGVAMLNPQFVQKSGLLFLIKHHFNKILQDQDGNYSFSFSWE